MLRFCAREAIDRGLKGSNLKLFAKFNNCKNVTTGFSSNCTTLILLASSRCILFSKNQTVSNSHVFAQWWTFSKRPIGPNRSPIKYYSYDWERVSEEEKQLNWKKGWLAQSRAILGTASGEERTSSAIRISRLICGQGSAHCSARNNFHYQLGLGRCIIFCSSYKAFLQPICIRKKKRLEMLFCYALLHIMTSEQLEQCNCCHTLRDDEPEKRDVFKSRTNGMLCKISLFWQGLNLKVLIQPILVR